MVEKKRRNNTKPTLKQRTAFKNVVENGGNKGKGMRDAGYSKAMAKSPKKLTETKSWEDLMEKYLPDNLLTKKHRELLNKKETVIKNNNKNGNIEIVKTGEIDQQAVKAGLDMAYKLKDKYAATKIKFKDENEDITDEEIEDELARVRNKREKFAKKSNVKEKTKSA